MPFDYTKTQLSQLGITALKKVAKDCGVTRYSKYKTATKDQLVEKIWEKCSGDAPTAPAPTVPTTPTVPTAPKPKRIHYDFQELMPLNINLVPYQAGTQPSSNEDEITPEVLLGMIRDDAFCRKIAGSLRDIYKAKEAKYRKLEKKTKKSIDNDKAEKARLKHEINNQDLEKMFPMIAVNQVFLIKLQKLRKLALEKYEEFSRMNAAIISKVRKNLTAAITDEDNGIVSISGDARAPIRNQLCRQLYILSKGYRSFMDAFLNMVFTGPAGVGKTKLATAVGYIYEHSGILLIGEVIVVSPKDMVSQWVGATAAQTAGVLMKGLESVIFIDEAYQIMPCKNGKIEDGKSYGPEAITEIVNFLDKYMGLSIMIVAGYKREIDGCFFEANEGLQRRFPIRMELPKYSDTDLLNIFINEVSKRLGKNVFTKESALYVYTLIVKLNTADDKIFVNQAGDIMNLVSMFLNSYYGSWKIQWGTYGSDVLIINGAFNQFLKNKGYTMQIST